MEEGRWKMKGQSWKRGRADEREHADGGLHRRLSAKLCAFERKELFVILLEQQSFAGALRLQSSRVIAIPAISAGSAHSVLTH